MKVLAIESSTPCGNVAIADGEKTLASRRLTKNAEELASAVEEILAETSTPKSALGLVAVSAGPGFFTSLKVGAAAAKAFAFALDIPVAPVPSLEILAAGADCPSSPRPVCAAIDARSGLFFRALFEKRGETLKRVSEDALVTADELAALAEKLKAEAGTGGFTAALQESGADTKSGADTEPPSPLFTVMRAEASVCAALGTGLWKQGKTETAASFSPRYLRDDLYRA